MPYLLNRKNCFNILAGKAFGATGRAYIDWATKIAVGMGTGVPCIMCREDDAPDPVMHKLNIKMLSVRAKEIFSDTRLVKLIEMRNSEEAFNSDT
ncbi:Beta-galactosidase [Thalictrum thalictroides]|uniref:Beta-galactosidase n=1 Tax=Thalictrum thalictroides TaxID=46969 RepID=A0A7J6X2V2_THATH|nr:Beta-galactosidase [Thalictrum thalictroides]